MQPTIANVALIAGERVRKLDKAFGQRSAIKPILDELAATYGIRLTEAQALQAARSASGWMRDFEEIIPGRWLSDEESAALGLPIAA
ncbi:hypothetical protein [Rhizobium sullae]|uniref:hypothetical protein n=1 Tax=Rhizobium sullae TaxID=50338 RepID=UPI000B355033|nr:hypothetical protein [Rhizobium sullae]